MLFFFRNFSDQFYWRKTSGLKQWKDFWKICQFQNLTTQTFKAEIEELLCLCPVSNSSIGKQFEMCLNFRGKRLWQSILEFGGIVTSQEGGPH
jgi:hypothetical protein